MLDYEDQPSNSIEEVDQLNLMTDLPELQDERSYECMYCKHGFTTAQALGGHMNVHRKDKAKSLRSDSSNNKSLGTRLYEPCLITRCTQIHHHHQGKRTHDFMSRSSLGSITSPSRDEMRLRLSLNLQFGWSDEEDSICVRNQEDGLDLELRLGHDP